MNTAPAPAAFPGVLGTLAGRGFLEQVSDPEGLARLLDPDAGRMVTAYAGFDPTADSLHVGHLVPVLLLRALQRLGHRPIVVVGGGTAMVGDPSGKSETRRMLDAATLAANAQGIRAQLGRFLHFDTGAPHDALMVDNASWLLELRYVEFLRDFGVHFTVNRMIAAKTYRERLENELPLSFLEFNYQLLQAYDFLHLHREYGCTLQIGGSDQWGNMVAGVDLIRRRGGEHGDGGAHAHCATMPLLTTADGKKMGKTERGALWLDARRVSVFDFFQYWVGCHDDDVARLLRLFTDLDLAEIDELCAHRGAELNVAKVRLATEVTALVHGGEAAQAARVASQQAFGEGEDWSAVPEVVLAAPAVRLVDLVVDPPVAAFRSRREARQRIEDGAVRIDGAPCRDPNTQWDAASTPPEGLRLQAGKRARFRVRFAPMTGAGGGSPR